MVRSRIGRDSDDVTIFADKQSSFRDRPVLNGVDRQSQSPDCWSLPGTCQKSGSFPPPALPGFISTTSLSATPKRPSLLLTESWLRATTSHRGASRVACRFLFHTCHRPDPGGTGRGPSLVPLSLDQRRPSLSVHQVGSRIKRFEACSAFTHVMACMLADSPRELFPGVLQSNSLPP